MTLYQQGLACASPPDNLLDCRTVCRLIGGSRPINPATLYRNIRKGIYPAPVHVGPGSSRWRRDEIEAVLQAMAEARQ